MNSCSVMTRRAWRAAIAFALGGADASIVEAWCARDLVVVDAVDFACLVGFDEARVEVPSKNGWALTMTDMFGLIVFVGA